MTEHIASADNPPPHIPLDRSRRGLIDSAARRGSPTRAATRPATVRGRRLHVDPAALADLRLRLHEEPTPRHTFRSAQDVLLHGRQLTLENAGDLDAEFTAVLDERRRATRPHLLTIPGRQSARRTRHKQPSSTRALYYDD